jgi:signal transduction histidine kinase
MLQGMTAHYLTHSTYPLKSGDTCLVQAAAGGTGGLIVQMAKMLGARVFGTVSTEEKAQIARQHGADETILYTQQDFEAEARRLTGGPRRRCGLRLGGPHHLSTKASAPCGRAACSLFGQSSGAGAALRSEHSERQGFAVPHPPEPAYHVQTREELLWRAGDVLGWIDAGKLKLRIDRTYPLAQAAEAHRALEGRHTTGKLLNGPTVLYVRVVVAPALIRDTILPRLEENAIVALFSVLGAALVTMLVSAVAFRPLSRLRRQIEAMTSEESKAAADSKGATDDLSVISSGVTQLGLQLRGAQFEVSDLRGNIGRLLRDLEDAVFLFNREGRLIFASGTVEKFTGVDAAALTGKTIAGIFPIETPLGLVIAEAAASSLPLSKRRVAVGSSVPSSTVAWALLSVDPLAAPGGAGSGTLIRLRDPEAQRKLGHELQTADRLAALSRVSGGVAHEVKNPLNAMLLHVEVARAKLSHGDTALEPQMDIISSEILRLDRVVKTFLDFTRPVELNLANMPVDEFVKDLVDLARPQADASGIRVAAEQKAEGVEVRIDRDLLKQALLNIVVNAIEAMPGGGDLRLESSVAGDTAEIRVADSGPGIPPDLREKIFRLYFTTKQKGSGIGLAMAFRIVQLHDGTIDFTSEPGKGTAFFIRLPIAA